MECPFCPVRDPQQQVIFRDELVLFLQESGGALADSRARVVGINTAVAGIGLGLAVPIDATTRPILGALMRDGRVKKEGSRYLLISEN